MARRAGTPRVVRAYQGAALAARAIPTRAIPFVAGLIGFVLGFRHDDRRTIIERNVRRTRGEVSRRAMRVAVRATYASYARYYLESFKLPNLGVDAVAHDFTVDGFEHVRAGLDGPVGPILALPHLGGWEWAGFWLALVPHATVTAVAEALEPPELSAWFTDLRARMGMHIITLGPDAGRGVSRAIADGHVTCLLCDRLVDGASVEVEFFGERTHLPAGPAMLALRTGAPLLPTAVYFRGAGHHAVVRPPVPAVRESTLRADVARVTQLLAAELEVLIRAAPEQWHLLQPNWPSDLVALGRPPAAAGATAAERAPAAGDVPAAPAAGEG